jgi:hypothetical protein
MEIFYRIFRGKKFDKYGHSNKYTLLNGNDRGLLTQNIAKVQTKALFKWPGPAPITSFFEL